MRKLMLFCLLASAAMPALARPKDSDERRADRPERSQSQSRSDSGAEARRAPVQREPRSFGGGSEGSERRHVPVQREPQDFRGTSGGGEPRVRVERPERVDSGSDGDSRRRWGGDGRANPVPWSRDGVGAHDERRNRVRDRRAEERRVRNPADAAVDEARRERWQRDRRASRPNDGIWDEQRRARSGWTPREGSQPPARLARADRDSPRSHWRRDWRNDRRHDWRRHRDRNRSAFRIGLYYDPFGWNYRQFNVGWRLWPDYYSARYWIDDPWQYRLPSAHPGTRWIRYHNDALLVDVWTGEVIDVVYGFFW